MTTKSENQTNAEQEVEPICVQCGCKMKLEGADMCATDFYRCPVCGHEVELNEKDVLDTRAISRVIN